MKLITKIVGVTLGLAMAVGVGVGVAANRKTNMVYAEPTLTFSLTSNPGGWPTAYPDTLTDYTYTLDDVDYTFSLKNVKQNSGYLMLQQVAVMGLPAISGKKLTQVVAYNSGGCSTSTRVGVSSSSSTASYINGGAYQTWSTQGSSYTYTLTGTAGNTQYYLYVTNKNAQITSLVLTYENAGGAPTATGFTLNAPSGNLEVGDTHQFTPTFQPDGASGTVSSWSSSHPNVATIDDTGLVKAVGEGTTTITATASNLDDVECEITVNAPTSIDVSNAVETANALDNNAVDPITYIFENKYILGITTPWDDGYKNVSYNLGDSIDSQNGLLVFRTIVDDNTDGSELKAGDKVTVVGKLKNYYNDKNGSNTPELINGVTTLVEASVTQDVNNLEEVATPRTVAQIKACTSANNTIIAKVTGVAEQTYGEAQYGNFYLADPSTGEAIVVYGGYQDATFERNANVYNTKESSKTNPVTSAAIGHSVTVYGTIGVHNNVGQLIDARVEIGAVCTATVSASVSVNDANMGSATISATSIGYGGELVVTPTPAEGYKVATVEVQRASKTEQLSPELNGTFKFNAEAKNAVTVTFAIDKSSFVYTSVAKYCFENTNNGTAVTNVETIKGWFSKVSGNSILNSVSSPTNVAPGAAGGSTPNNWTLNNALKIGTASKAGSLTLNLSEQVDKIVITGYAWNNSVTLTIGSEEVANALSENLANKTNVDADNVGTVSAEIDSSNSITISDTTAIVIRSIEFFELKTGREVVESISTSAALSYNYTKTNDVFEYSDVKIRFGGYITETLWNALNSGSTIQGYGVMISTADTNPTGYLGTHTFKSEYATALELAKNDVDEAINLLCDNVKIHNFYKTGTPYLYEAATNDNYEENTYAWNLVQNITSPANLTRTYVAIAYVRTANGLVFLEETRKSVSDLAEEMIASPNFDDSSFEGSLKGLADL